MRYLFILFLFIGCASDLQTIRPSGFNWDSKFLSIMQGATGVDYTIINFIMPKHFVYEANIYSDQTPLDKNQVQTIVHTRKNTPWKIIELHLNNLDPKNNYRLEVKVANKKYSYTDIRYFKTLSNNNSHRVSISSCMADTYLEIAEKAWANVIKEDIDALFLIGDTVYADYHNGRYISVPVMSTDAIWSRYIDARHALPLYRLKNLKPIFASWDDHDLGKNNGDKNYRFIKDAQKIFRQFFPVKNEDKVTLGPGISFKLNLGNDQFYFLDNRSFRDDDDFNQGDHLGKKQLGWLEKNLRNSQSDKTWLILGDQFFGGYHRFESYQGNHPREFKTFLKLLRDINKEIYFISGDRHLYEFMKIDEKVLGRKTYEITTSGIHAKIFPHSGKKIHNPYRVNLIDDEYNSVILKTGKKPFFKVINHKGETLDKNKLIQ